MVCPTIKITFSYHGRHDTAVFSGYTSDGDLMCAINEWLASCYEFYR
jgi:hypothetical protein